MYLTSYSRGRGRALRLFGAVVKELARKGLPRDRRVLREDAALLLPDVAAALRQASSSSDIDAIRILAKAATRLLNHSRRGGYDGLRLFSRVGPEGHHGVHGRISQATT